MERLRRNTLGMLSMLIAQFLLGMGVNLFIKLPADHPGANPSEFFGGATRSIVWALTDSSIVLVAHVILGFLLAIDSIVILVAAFKLPSTAVRVLASLGVVGIVLAGISGASFLSYNKDSSSYLMSVGFALAAVVYTQLLVTVPTSALEAQSSS